MALRELIARRDAVRAELRTLHTAADGGALAEPAQTRWDALTAELTTLDGAERRQADIDAFDRAAPGLPLDGPRAAGVGLLDVIRAQMGGTDPAAERARQASRAMEERSGRKAEGLLWDMRAPMESRVVTTALPAAGPGSNVIGLDYRPDLFIDRLRNATRVRALGATVLSGLVGNVAIPRLKASVAAGWVAENTPLPVSDMQFDGVTLTPKHAGVITEFSRNMVLQASPDVETLARNDMAQVLGELLDAAAIAGTGTANQPRGILSTPGIGLLPLGTNGGPVSYSVLADLMGLVEAANAEGSTAAFLTNTTVRRFLARMTDTVGQPIGLDVMFHNAAKAFTNLVPSNGAKGTGTNLSAMIYGNWSDLLIGVWSELDILVNPYESAAYSKGNVSIRAMMTVDIAVRHPESFAAITDIAA